MASPSVGEANQQQLWDDALTRLLNLSTATVKRNAELETRLSELEVELSVWKQAHSAALELSEREARTHNVQLASLNRQLSSLESFRNQNPLILCVVDGDENIFTQSLLTQGQQGGRLAAQQLTKSIAEYLSNEEVHVFGRLSFWITVYFNKMKLREILLGHDICTQEEFEAFLVGFSQASPRFLMVDVGHGKDGADAKVREYLQTYIRFSQTLRVFLGGPHDNRYLSILTALESEDLLGKIVWLQDHDDMVAEFRQLGVPFLQVDGLFMAERLPYKPQNSPPLIANGFGSTPNGGLMSPQSPVTVTARNGGGRLIDPSQPLHKQNPPPCNEHYLMSCSKGSACKYAHDYLLTQEQLATLANNAKKAPCNFLKNGLPCPYGDRCCWGHSCPNGPKCFHLSKGKCWFKGDAMHPSLETRENGS